MPKALEAEMLVENQEYSKAAKIYYQICLISDDVELAKRATQVSGYASNFDLMLKSSDRWLALAENKISVMHVRLGKMLLKLLQRFTSGQKKTKLGMRLMRS